ncbi:MAG: integrase [Ruminococcaceae bacterium]|nr:integrase [Oscillospiraceae bacterium]
MKRVSVTRRHLAAFRAYLWKEEKSRATVEKYLRDMACFAQFAADRPVSREIAIAWKQYLEGRGYAVRTINSMLVSLNRFLEFLGRSDCRVKTIRVQRQTYSAAEQELSREEYLRLLTAAQNRPQLHLVIETICATGIRVSELRHFTAEAVRQSEVTIHCKGKIRTILIPGALRKKLLRFAASRGIAAGPIFLTRGGKPLDRSTVWRQMKSLCGLAGVNPAKVFPHNLRKLFARTFYAMEKDIAKLADILGHSSIETTRIYLMTTGREHLRKLERLGLVT